MKKSHLFLTLSVIAGSTAIAHGPRHDPDPETPPPAFVPRNETGYSSIEQKWVYAHPDKGEFRVPLVVGALPRELNVATPEMCEGEVDSWVNYKYDRKKNKVWVTVHIEGMPTEPPTICYSDYQSNPSTQFNEYPDCVEDGVWQVWTIGNLFHKDMTFWYDATTLQLLGGDDRFPNGPPAGSFPVIIPGVQMVCSPELEPNRKGVIHSSFEYDFNNIVDMLGNAGTAAAFVPFSLCEPDRYTGYYVDGGLDPNGDDRFTFDAFLESIWYGYGISAATSYEPRVKPDYLASRDNLMIGHVGFYPQVVPPGYNLEMTSQTLKVRETCETHQADPWAGPYHDLCTP